MFLIILLLLLGKEIKIKIKLSSFQRRKLLFFISCSVALEAIGELVRGKLYRNMSRKGKNEEKYLKQECV